MHLKLEGLLKWNMNCLKFSVGTSKAVLWTLFYICINWYTTEQWNINISFYYMSMMNIFKSYFIENYTKKGTKRGNTKKKNEEVSRWKAQINQKRTQKLNWYVSTFTEVFLNQKRINVCEHTLKMAPHLLRITVWNVTTILQFLHLYRHSVIKFKSFLFFKFFD